MAFIIRTLIISSFLLGTQTISAQTKFAKLYTATGYDYGRDIIQSFQDSGLVVTGSSSSFITGTADALILKTDSIGNFEWSYAYGGPDSDWGNKIIQTQDTGYVIAGYTNSYGAGGFDFYVVKTDQYGQHLWDTTFGGADWDIAHSVIQLPSKDIVIVGETQSYGNGNKDAYIVCLDSAGGFLWERTYGGAEDDIVYDLDYDGDSLWIVGSTASFSTDQNKDAWILNFNLNTIDTNYTDTIGGPGDDEFYAVEHHAPRIYFAGMKTVPTYNKDSWIRIYDNASNTLINEINYSLSNDEVFNDIQTSTAFSTVFCVGSTNSAGYALIDNKEEIYLNANTYDGIYLNFVTTFGEEGVDVGYGIAETYLNETMVYVGDSKYNSTGGNGILIFRLGLSDYNIQTTDIVNMQITTSIESDNENLDFDFAIYPNPTQNRINIKCSKHVQKVLIYNLNGSIVLNENNTSTINIKHFNAGMYIVKVKVDDQWVFRKVIKE